MELNVNVNVRVENLDTIVAALAPLANLLSHAAPVEAPVVQAEEPVTEEKPVKRGRPRKAKVEEPKVEEHPVVEEPVAEEPKAEEPVAEEPKAEEPKAEEPKDLLPALRAQCMALSRVAGADRVLQVIKSFGFKGLTAVPVEKHAELLQILVDEIKAAEDK